MALRWGFACFCLPIGLLSPAPAPALSALFDFQDFPDLPSGIPPSDDPYTDLYGCDGKTYCSVEDMRQALQIGGDDVGELSTLSKQVDGITMTVSRPTGSWQVYINYFGGPGFGQKSITTTNGDVSYELFRGDFDVDAAYVSMTAAHPQHLFLSDETGVHEDAYFRLYLWEGASATGDLVASLLLSPHDDLPSGPFQIELAAPAGQTFRSMSFGHAYSLDPDCIQSCPETDWDNYFFFDNVFVSTIPEPGTGGLLALGLLALGYARATARQRAI